MESQVDTFSSDDASALIELMNSRGPPLANNPEPAKPIAVRKAPKKSSGGKKISALMEANGIINKVNTKSTPATNQEVPNSTQAPAPMAFHEPTVREISLFPRVEAVPTYSERDLDIIKIDITELFYVSYNLKDVCKTGGKKGRMECFQLNRKYTSREGEAKVFSMKINDYELENTIKALACLLHESKKRQ